MIYSPSDNHPSNNLLVAGISHVHTHIFATKSALPAYFDQFSDAPSPLFFQLVATKVIFAISTLVVDLRVPPLALSDNKTPE